MKMQLMVFLLLFFCWSCFSGSSCSTMCGSETTVETNLTVTSRHLVLSSGRKTHPANRSFKGQLSMAALKIVAQTIKPEDITQPGLTDAQRKKRAQRVQKNALKQIKAIEKQQAQEQAQAQRELANAEKEAAKLAREVDRVYTEQRLTAKRKG